RKRWLSSPLLGGSLRATDNLIDLPGIGDHLEIRGHLVPKSRPAGRSEPSVPVVEREYRTERHRPASATELRERQVRDGVDTERLHTAAKKPRDDNHPFGSDRVDCMGTLPSIDPEPADHEVKTDKHEGYAEQRQNPRGTAFDYPPPKRLRTRPKAS